MATLRAAYEAVLQRSVQLQQEAQTPEVIEAVAILDVECARLRNRLLAGEAEDTVIDEEGAAVPQKAPAPKQKSPKPKKTPKKTKKNGKKK